MSFVVVTPPASEPLSPADIRARLNLGATQYADATLTSLVQAARLTIERQYGIAIITQTLDYTRDQFPYLNGYGNPNLQERGFYPSQYYSDTNRLAPVGQTDILLPICPIQSVTNVKYLDSSGIQQTLDPSTYVLSVGDSISKLSQAYNSAWPTSQFVSNAVVVRIVAGYGAATDVPETLKTVIALYVNHLRSMLAQNIFLSLDSVTGVGEKRYMVGKSGTDVIDSAIEAMMADYRRVSL